MLKLARLHNGPEIFHTIQGEGKNIGIPSVFVRLSLCNLYCVWCDTDYTWNWEGTNYTHIRDTDPSYRKFRKDEYIIELPVDDIVTRIESYNCRHIVITGGEPLVQQKELVSLLTELKKSNRYHVEFETNGTITPTENLDELVDQYNVSAKLSNAGVSLRDRLRKPALEFFAGNNKANFKFVIDSDNDLDELLAIVTEYRIDKEKVFLMPQGLNTETLRQKQQWLIEVCKKYGFRYTDRIHIHIYGEKRGV